MYCLSLWKQGIEKFNRIGCFTVLRTYEHRARWRMTPFLYHCCHQGWECCHQGRECCHQHNCFGNRLCSRLLWSHSNCIDCNRGLPGIVSSGLACHTAQLRPTLRAGWPQMSMLRASTYALEPWPPRSVWMNVISPPPQSYSQKTIMKLILRA